MCHNKVYMDKNQSLDQIPQKSEEEIRAERAKAFEQEYINKINEEYQQTLSTFSSENRPKKEQIIFDTFQEISKRLAGQDSFEFLEKQKAILKLKLARHFQNNETIDINVLFDAIIESPKFINTDKGSLHRLLEVHQQKTLQKIAEIRKQRAEMTGNESFNPYEALFETKSGKYYLARLLNMPHLEEESKYMNHCVGTSDSYINKIKNGEVEIFSLRKKPTINKKTNKIRDDKPIVTIEYNRKTKVIEQIKKAGDKSLEADDVFFVDVIDALKQLKTTKTDTGELRDFKIADSIIEMIPIESGYILTENGKVHFRDFDPDAGVFVLRIGPLEIKPTTTKEDASKILRIVEGIKVKSEEIAYNLGEVTENTKVYIGKWGIEISKKIAANVLYLYESFPDDKIVRTSIEIGTKTGKEYGDIFKSEGLQMSDYSQKLLNEVVALKSPEKIDLISFSVEQLGFEDNVTLDEIHKRAKELGLELCPPQVGPELRLSYRDQPSGERLWVAMESITVHDGYPHSFYLVRTNDGVLHLRDNWNSPAGKCNLYNKLVFRLPKK